MAALALPAFNGWMLPDDAGEILRGLVEQHRPELILECGSGRSTVHLAAAARDFGGRVVSLEHQLDFADATTAMLLENDLEEFAEVRYAPLGEDPVWYTTVGWSDLAGIGLLFVDGPPGFVAPYARQPALELLDGRLAPGCVVVLDDMQRKSEKLIWLSWRELGLSEPGFVQHSNGYLAVGELP